MALNPEQEALRNEVKYLQDLLERIGEDLSTLEGEIERAIYSYETYFESMTLEDFQDFATEIIVAKDKLSDTFGEYKFPKV